MLKQAFFLTSLGQRKEASASRTLSFLFEFWVFCLSFGFFLEFFNGIFCQFLKIDQKLPLKNSKLKKNPKLKQKNQNSSKKLRVREALASFLCPSDVKKKVASPLRKRNLPKDICPNIFAQFLFAQSDICPTKICPKWNRNLPKKTSAQSMKFHWYIDIYLLKMSLFELFLGISRLLFPCLLTLILEIHGTLLDIVNQWYFGSNWKFHAYCCIQEIEIVDLYLNSTCTIEVWTCRHCRVVIWANFFWAVVLWANFLLYWAK